MVGIFGDSSHLVDDKFFAYRIWECNRKQFRIAGFFFYSCAGGLVNGSFRFMVMGMGICFGYKFIMISIWLVKDLLLFVLVKMGLFDDQKLVRERLSEIYGDMYCWNPEKSNWG